MLRWAANNRPVETKEAIIGEYEERKKAREANESALKAK